LLTGYDDAESAFNIIDVTDSSTFYSVISYEQLLLCYQGWLDWQGNSAYVKMAKLYRVEGHSHEQAGYENGSNFSRYKYNFSLKRDEILKGLNHLLESANYLQEVGLDDSFFELEKDHIGVTLFFIVNSKKLEMYRTHKLLAASKHLFGSQKSISNNWQIISATFSKMLLTKRIGEKSIETIANKLRENHTLERVQWY
jgi:hypothetical protein